MVGYGFTCLLIGPSKFLNLPPNFWFICAAFPLLGAFNYFAFIPLIPEMLEAMQKKLGVVEGKDLEVDEKINDLVNDIYGFTYAFGNFVWPPLGAFLYMKLGGPETGDTIACINFTIGSVLITTYYGRSVI